MSYQIKIMKYKGNLKINFIKVKKTAVLISNCPSDNRTDYLYK